MHGAGDRAGDDDLSTRRSHEGIGPFDGRAVTPGGVVR
jgi:hypothetical protein